MAGADQASGNNAFGGWNVENRDKNSQSSSNGQKEKKWGGLGFDGRQQDNAGNLSRPSAWINTTSSAMSPILMWPCPERRRLVVGCLSRDRRSFVAVGQRWPRPDENQQIGPLDENRTKRIPPRQQYKNFFNKIPENIIDSFLFRIALPLGTF